MQKSTVHGLKENGQFLWMLYAKNPSKGHLSVKFRLIKQNVVRLLNQINFQEQV